MSVGLTNDNLGEPPSLRRAILYARGWAESKEKTLLDSHYLMIREHDSRLAWVFPFRSPESVFGWLQGLVVMVEDEVYYSFTRENVDLYPEFRLLSDLEKIVYARWL
jgi:hypothetical protein